jgi:hypothetical protein
LASQAIFSLQVSRLNFLFHWACYMSLQSRTTEVELFKGFKYAGKFFSRNTWSDVVRWYVATKCQSPNDRRERNTGGNGTVQKLSMKTCLSINTTTTNPLCTVLGLEPGSPLWNVGD